jgi:hypothetical protein
MTVDELLGKIDSRELTEWQAFERMNGPIDPYERLDRAAALIAERVTYMLSSPKGRKKIKGVEQFVPKWGQEEVSEDGDDS